MLVWIKNSRYVRVNAYTGRHYIASLDDELNPNNQNKWGHWVVYKRSVIAVSQTNYVLFDIMSGLKSKSGLLQGNLIGPMVVC